jgi:hypothetical protein
MVAEALTEEQAAEEIARTQAEASRKRQEAEARRAARRAEKAERQARKAAVKAEAAQRRKAQGDAAPRMTVSLSTPALVSIAGLFCLVVLGAFSIGRQSKQAFSKVPTVAALSNKPAQDSPKPSAPAPAQPAKPFVAKPITKPIVPKPAAAMSPDLSALLKKPEPRPERPVSANRPLTALAEESAPSDLPEDQNYLQIESFLVTRERDGEQLAADLAHVRKFLLDRGVRTFARRRTTGGYVLFCEQGVAPGRENAGQREALRKKIEQLGQEYRAAGGLYQFKGCLFVNYASTKVGDPV